MANAEHLEILKSGVKEWNKWKDKFNGRGLNLIGADLSDVDFTNATLIGADLGNVDFTNANLSGANLIDANLNGANLRDANLSGANLSDANLGSANLENATLRFANLIRSDLVFANLKGANLSCVNLTNTNLRFANLVSANLIFASLEGADLLGAVIGHTVFGHTDLTNCVGLETIRVSVPCTIDFQTLRASKNIPKSFLLKIGLPELYINYLPDFYQDEGIRLYPVFLSHSWENKDFARKLYEALIAKGVNVFFDEKKMKPGDDIYKSISRGIEHYDKMLLVCSEAALKSWWVDRELDRILKKERSLYKEEGEHIDLLIPITIDDHVFTWNGAKGEEVRRYVIGDFRDWQDEAKFEKALNGLIHALNVDRPEIKPPSFLKNKKT